MTIQQIAADNIRHIREKRNISQESLALDAKMSRSYVGEIERAEKTISISRLEKLARVLQVEVHELLIKNYFKQIK